MHRITRTRLVVEGLQEAIFFGSVSGLSFSNPTPGSEAKDRMLEVITVALFGSTLVSALATLGGAYSSGSIKVLR